MDWLSSICDIVILASAVGIALKNILEWIGKPLSFLKGKNDARIEQRLEKFKKDELPEILYDHDCQTRVKYLSDRQQYLQDIKEEVLINIRKELEEISVLSEQYDALVISAKDVLREKIMAIYNKNKLDKHITFYEREALDQYYKDYKKIGGNSYIDKYYNRMSVWTVGDDDIDI